jgi:uncharacterized membrane protein HdeD (DUF308 family)
MSTNVPYFLSGVTEELHELRRNWGWFLALGIALIVLGLCAIGSAFIATLATVMTFGILALVGGGVEIASAFWARRWGGFFLHLLAGVLYIVFGFFMFAHPIAAAAAITLMMAALFFVGGLLRIVVALSYRFHGWGWVVLNGAVTLVLGVLIWRQWPEASFWVIGMFLGIELVFTGMSWVMLAMAVRALPAPEAPREATPGQPVGV